MSAKYFISAILAAAQIGGFNPSLPPADSYDGENMTIAILDCGFYLDHESFVLEDNTPRITKEISDSLLTNTTISKYADIPESLYVSPKIPFAYDYGDKDSDVSQNIHDYHGTAMISIAAGNQRLAEEKRPEAEGIAPEAQILAMKVYSDTLGDVTESAMCEAIEDSIVFDADVIFIALTQMCGFENSEKTEKINTAIKKAEDAGVIVITAAGDVMNYGRGSIFDRELSISFPLTSSPDVGTIAWPGTISSTLCVTSAISNTIKSDCFTLSSGSRIPYSDSNPLFSTTENGKSFSEHFDGRTLEYVITEGVGKPEELAAAGGLTGKLAVINRGEITFAEKAINAANLGAIGVIVIDTQSSSLSTLKLTADLTGATIPLIIIPSSDGEKLVFAGNKSITVKSGEEMLTKTRKTPSPSQNIAYGTTPELGLKPDLAAIGDNVLAATRDGEYAYMTSTTAAAAKIAGMCTLVKARFKDRFPEMNKKELMHITKSALVGSAELMSPEHSAVYSPRIQGGGFADFSAAMNTSLILNSNGTYKIELGDSHERSLNFKITAYNLSSIKKMCRLDAIIGSNYYDEFTASALISSDKGTHLYERLGYSKSDKISFILPFTEFENATVTIDGESCQLNAASDDFSPLSFVIESNSSRTFDINITLDEETYSTYRDQFENGFFIEGFIRLTSGKDSASIPLVAFSGDFGDAPALDADIYTGKQSIFENTYMYINSPSSSDPYSNVLGRIIRNDSVEYDIDRIVFSPTTQGRDSSVMLNFSLLRSVCDVSVTVSSGDEIINSKNYDKLPRTYYDYLSETLVSPKLYIWNGRAHDNSAYIYPDGEYTVTVSFRTVGSEKLQQFSYKLSLDSTPPTLEDYKFTSATTIRITAADNHSVDSISIRDSNASNAEFRGGNTWDIGDLTGKYIYITILDAALNTKVVRLENPAYTEPAA